MKLIAHCALRQRRRPILDKHRSFYALAETINGLYKAEVIWRKRTWRSLDAVEYATIKWVDWCNNRRLLESIGNIPPAEAEAACFASREETAIAAQPEPNRRRRYPGGSAQQVNLP